MGKAFSFLYLSSFACTSGGTVRPPTPLARSARTSHNPREKVSYESQRRGRPAVARATRSILCVTPGCHSVNQAVSCVGTNF